MDQKQIDEILERAKEFKDRYDSPDGLTGAIVAGEVLASDIETLVGRIRELEADRDRAIAGVQAALVAARVLLAVPADQRPEAERRLSEMLAGLVPSPSPRSP